MKRVVFDTNVVVSACFWRGPSSHCLDAWVRGEVVALASPAMFAEYSEVFDRLRHRYPEKAFVDWVSALRNDAELVFPAVSLPDAFEDPADACFAECAVAGEADSIVSGDKAHMQHAGDVRGIPVLSPVQFLATLHDHGH